MHILITGASGFLGQFLAKQLLSTPDHTLLMTDVVDVSIPKNSKHPSNATTLTHDLVHSDPAPLLKKRPDAIYIFHGIMSSGSESNFELGMSVNFDATRSLLNAVRRQHLEESSSGGGSSSLVRVIYASSQAVYGQPLPKQTDTSTSITESTLPTPQGSYGTAKLMVEQLINDFTRRNFIDGFSLRFPTVTVRPGAPSQAASSFISGIIREPLGGKECIVPIQDRDFQSWVCSPRTLVTNLVKMLDVDSDKVLERHVRSVNAPGSMVSVQEMMDALAKVGGKDKLDLVKEVEDPETERILRSWAYRFDNSLAYELGLEKDQGFEVAVRQYVEWMKEE